MTARARRLALLLIVGIAFSFFAPRRRQRTPPSCCWFCGKSRSSVSESAARIQGRFSKNLVTFEAQGIPESEAAAVLELALALSPAQNSSEPLRDPLTLYRFYLACRKDVQKAVRKFREALSWRTGRRLPIEKVMTLYGFDDAFDADSGRQSDALTWPWQAYKRRSLESKLVTRHVSFARLQRLSPNREPILVWRIRCDDFDSFRRDGLHDHLVDAFVAHAEDTLQSLRAESMQQQRLLRARFIIDIKGLGFGSVRFIPVLREATEIGQRYYPEITASVTIIRAPAIAASLYKFVRGVLPERFQRKICILGKDFEEGLAQHTGLRSDDLPPLLGGSSQEDLERLWTPDTLMSER